MSTVLAGIIILFVLYVAWTLYGAFLGPLSKVPGPLMCKTTGLVDAYTTVVQGRRSEWIHDLHRKYGKLQACKRQSFGNNKYLGTIVRISPTLCSINDPDALKVVYGGKFPKSDARYIGKSMDGMVCF